MRTIFVTILFLGAFLKTEAQELTILKKLDTPDSLYFSKVVVNNNATINLNPKTDVNVSAYRVRLYFDNSQDARSIAYSIQSRFESEYPMVPVKVEYKVPNFMVTAGYFLTHVEATSFLAKIQPSFTGAFIIPVEVPMSTFKLDYAAPVVVEMPMDSTFMSDEIQ